VCVSRYLDEPSRRLCSFLTCPAGVVTSTTGQVRRKAVRFLSARSVHAGPAGPVLLLYWNPYRRLREAVASHLRAVRAAVPTGSVLAVNTALLGAPQFLSTVRPSAVVLHTTFLGMRWASNFERTRQQTEWIGKCGVDVIALPQDDYDHADVLDEWLVEMGATAVLSPFAEHGDFYSKARKQARMVRILTGYVDRSRAAVAPALPLADRPHDVVYRASSLPYWFGSFGQMKSSVARVALAEAASRGLSADISTTDVIYGSDWYRHLSSGRVVVGCEGGSSVFDGRGNVRRRIEEILSESPDAAFEEVDRRMPAGWDSRMYSALSPRHLEAVLTRTPQVLVEGEYSGVLLPGKHYVPVSRDLSDLGDALEEALHPEVGRRLADQAFVDVVESGEYGYEHLTELVRRELPPRVGIVPAWSRSMTVALGLGARGRRAGSALRRRVRRAGSILR